MSKIFRARLWINGEWQTSSQKTDIHSPYTRQSVCECDQASFEQIESALSAAESSFRKFRASPRFKRSLLLADMAQGIANRRVEFVERMVLEGGKPAVLSDVEVSRAISTLTLAAEEVKRWGGDVIPIDIEASGAAYSPAISMWVPRGPVLAIAPFNFPLNLIMHKVAPALAAGCSIIVKPPPQDPGCATLLAEVFAEAAKKNEIPLATLQVISGSNDVIGRALTDSRISTVSFTGSEKAGWYMQEKSIGKKIVLELGGNAGVIVHSDADLERAAARIAYGAYAYAGQICISVQRIFVQKTVADAFEKLLITEIKKLKVGDPSDKAVMVGPVIDEKNAERILAWTDEAKTQGARIVLGGDRSGNMLSPILIKNVRRDAKVNCEEVFGPLATLEVYDEFDEALTKINDSKFGLQAGLFTASQKFVHQAFETIEVGGLIINDVPTFRADNMPYGGVKMSGLGREGVRYAMESYSERRTLVEWRSL
jgi:acyl-CoA reductase-like NAD-dependent aldehyde dehydrogenase